MTPKAFFSLAALTLLAAPYAIAQKAAATGTATQSKPAAPAPARTSVADAEVIASQRPSYPLTTCVACGKALTTTPVEYVHGSQLFRLDADACKKAIDADPAAMVKKIDEAVIAQQKPTYPLRTSPVFHKPLERTSVDHVHGTRLVRLANQEEVAAFEKAPAPAMAEVDKALIDAQLAAYPLKTCPVSGDPLDKHGSPVNFLYGVKLVRFCSAECLATFQKDPLKYARAISAS